jgi:hypothetical protein
MSAAEASPRRFIGLMDAVGFGGTGSVMIVADVLSWARTAEPGSELVYGIGHLPAWSKTPKLIRDLDDQGLVFAFHDREQTPKHYVVRRLSKAWCEPVARLRIAREIPPRDQDQARLLAVLVRTARAGKPCPSNRDLARLADLTNGDRASYLIKCLAAGGHIRAEATAILPGRIVTIIGKTDAEGRDLSTTVVEGVRR